jgi:hypothetical protein
MWVNVLDTAVAKRCTITPTASSPASSYLTPTHPEARTVFMKSPGGTDFAFKNDHAGVVTGPYNADKWISPTPEPGDLVLFPSYLMHAVPPNPGGAASRWPSTRFLPVWIPGATNHVQRLRWKEAPGRRSRQRQ